MSAAEPDYVNPDSIAYQVYITAGVCLTLMVAFSLTRLLSKILFGPRKIKIDEIVFVVGLVLSFVYFSLTIACVSGNVYEKSIWGTVKDAPSFTKSQVVLSLLVQIIMPLSIGAVKVSVLILYWQVFHVLTWMRIACIAAITGITAFQLSLPIAFSAMCAQLTDSSIRDFLNGFLSESYMSTRGLVVTQGVGSVVIDMFLVILPLPPVLGLRMPLKRKIAVTSMFMVGLSACVASIIGLVYRVQFYTDVASNSRLVIGIWTTAMVEEAAAVIISCTPTTATFFKQAKTPVRSWLLYASERALRPTGSHRSDLPHSSSESELKDSLESDRNTTSSHLEAREDSTVRVDTELYAYSLRQINQTRPPASTVV